MTRQELVQRCQSLLNYNPFDDNDRKESGVLFADLLEAITSGSIAQRPETPATIEPAAPSPSPTKTRGQEVAERALHLDPVGSLVMRKWVDHPGYAYVVAKRSSENGVNAARKWLAALIDSERAEATRAEREACEKVADAFVILHSDGEPATEHESAHAHRIGNAIRARGEQQQEAR